MNMTPQEKAKETKAKKTLIRDVDLIAAELGEAIGFHFGTNSASIEEALNRLHRFVQHTHAMSPRTRWKKDPPPTRENGSRQLAEINKKLGAIMQKLEVDDE